MDDALAMEILEGPEDLFPERCDPFRCSTGRPGERGVFGDTVGEIPLCTETEEKLESPSYTESLKVLQRNNVFVSEIVHHLDLVFQRLPPAVVLGSGLDLLYGPNLADRKVDGPVYDAVAALPEDIVSI